MPAGRMHGGVSGAHRGLVGGAVGFFFASYVGKKKFWVPNFSPVCNKTIKCISRLGKDCWR